MNPQSDNEVIVKILNGNQELFRLLVDRYKSPVASIIKGMLGNCPEAEDVGQETFIKLYKSLGDFRGEASLKTYVIRIAMNLSLNELKRRKRLNSTTVYIDNLGFEKQNNDLTIAERTEITDMINLALSRLDKKQQSVFSLRIIQGYSTKETAEILNIPIGTVLSRLARAMEQMRLIVKR